MTQPTITIYATKTCPYCKMEKDWLERRNIEYTNYWVDEDAAKAKEMIDRSRQMGVPVTIVRKSGEEEIIVGFDKSKLADLLGLDS